MILGAEGKVAVGVTEAGQVLLTITSEDGTETSLALTWANWIKTTEAVKAQWLRYHQRLKIAHQDKLKQEGADALS